MLILHDFFQVVNTKYLTNSIIVYNQADWRALRGALVGCLALIRRKNNLGMVTSSDAKAVAQSFLQDLQVQSLGTHDRKVIIIILRVTTYFVLALEIYPEMGNKDFSSGMYFSDVF